MTKWKSPGQDDLIGRLDRLDRKIDELSRRPLQRDIVKARLYYPNYVGVGDERLVPGTWEAIPEVDTAGMYRHNVDGATYLEIPYDGRWRVRFDTAWAKQWDGTANYTAAAWLKLNDNTSLGPPFFYNTGENRLHDWGYLHIVAELNQVFTRGDQISPGVYASVSNAVVVGTHADSEVGGWDHPTYLMAEYIGPN